MSELLPCQCGNEKTPFVQGVDGVSHDSIEYPEGCRRKHVTEIDNAYRVICSPTTGGCGLRTANFDSKEEAVTAWNTRAQPPADLVDTNPKTLVKELLEEVIRNHADPDSPDYNECDKPGEKCKWCGDAETVLAALTQPSDNAELVVMADKALLLNDSISAHICAKDRKGAAAEAVRARSHLKELLSVLTHPVSGNAELVEITKDLVAIEGGGNGRVPGWKYDRFEIESRLSALSSTAGGVKLLWQNAEVCAEGCKGFWQGYEMDEGHFVLYDKDGQPLAALQLPPFKQALAQEAEGNG